MAALERMAREKDGYLEFCFNDWTCPKFWLAVYHYGDGNWSEAKDQSLAEALEKLTLLVEEFYAAHWCDDDAPEFECGFGVCSMLCRAPLYPASLPRLVARGFPSPGPGARHFLLLGSRFVSPGASPVPTSLATVARAFALPPIPPIPCHWPVMTLGDGRRFHCRERQPGIGGVSLGGGSGTIMNRPGAGAFDLDDCRAYDTPHTYTNFSTVPLLQLVTQQQDSIGPVGAGQVTASPRKALRLESPEGVDSLGWGPWIPFNHKTMKGLPTK